MRKSLITMAVSVLFVAMTGFMACAYDTGDFQIWHTEGQDVKFAEKWKLEFEEEFRFGDNASEFYYQHYDVGLLYEVNKNLNLSANYRQVWELKKGAFQPEYRPHINVTLKHVLWGFKLEDRNRLEYRAFDDSKGITRYRNKFTIKYPVKLKGLEIEPYVADEIFADLDDVVLNRNRLYAGFGIKIIKDLKIDVYYLLQSSKSSGRWVDANVFGSKVKISF